MDNCVNNNMANLNKVEKELNFTHNLLEQTADFIVSLINQKAAEIEKLKQEIEKSGENNLNEDLQEQFNVKILELNSLTNKMEWEKSEINKFEMRVEKYNIDMEKQFITNLSKKIVKPLPKKKD